MRIAHCKFSHYLAGIRVLSNRRAPLLATGSAYDASLRVLFCGPNTDPLPATAQPWYILKEAGRAIVRFRPDGKLVLIDAANAVGLDTALELRRVAPFAAALQGRITLHASAVEIGGAVVAFIGESSAGKSTWAWNLRELGIPVICDDLLPVRWRQSRPVVPCGDGAGTRLLPLRRMFFLQRQPEGDRIQLTPLREKTVLLELCRNGFGELHAPAAWRRQFEFYSRIAKTVPAARLEVRDDAQALERIVESFARDFLGLTLRCVPPGAKN